MKPRDHVCFHWALLWSQEEALSLTAISQSGKQLTLFDFAIGTLANRWYYGIIFNLSMHSFSRRIW